MIILNDAMSIVRARLERDLSRFNIRSWLLEIDASPHTHIFCWDGVANKELRRAFYPGYKSNRQPPQQSIFQGINFFREALAHTKAIQINVPGYEADDVIAAIAARAAGGGPIRIATRDYDLRQLVLLAPDITCDAPAKSHVDDTDIRLYKTWVGDPSDTVKGVKLFGDKSWEEANKETLMAITMAEVPDDALLERLPAEKHRRWVRENFAELKAMWKIVGFFPIEPDVINKHMVVGKSDLRALDDKLKGFFL